MMLIKTEADVSPLFCGRIVLAAMLLMVCAATASANEYWLTKGDLTAAFEEQGDRYLLPPNASTAYTIEIDTSKTYQEIEGFGYTLNGGSAMHLANMSSRAREAILQELFGRGESDIGVSYIRLSIGASDLDPMPFSYSDVPPGEVDPELKYFSIDKDRKYLIPIIKQILAINPDITFMGSPWSPPVWMKTNGSTIGGELKQEYYSSYAQYFVKYIQAMQQEGIAIDAITIQNEPMHPGNNPSLLMHPWDQADFIANHLGPAFEKAQLNTKIIIWDHNADKVEYPIEVLSNKKANAYIHGSAFHLYGGTIDALSKVKEAFPDKHLYFTEQWVGANSDFWGDVAWHVENLTIGAMRNWCKTVLEWNIAANSQLEPHTPGGCDACLGALTIDGDKVKRNAAYYIIAHASKRVLPGSKRVASTALKKLPNVAFLTPQGATVLIVLNNSDNEKQFTVKPNKHFSQKEAAYAIPANSVVTLSF